MKLCLVAILYSAFESYKNNIAIKTSRNSIYLFYQNNDIFLDKYLIKLLRFDFIISIINIVVKYEIEEKRGSERENRANETKRNSDEKYKLKTFSKRLLNLRLQIDNYVSSSSILLPQSQSQPESLLSKSTPTTRASHTEWDTD